MFQTYFYGININLNITEWAYLQELPAFSSMIIADQLPSGEQLTGASFPAGFKIF
jgi:hypothetical protein